MPHVEVVASRGSLGATRVTPFSTLTEVRPTPAVDAAFAKVGPDTLAKILFTSGSTGQPKGVINTQRMMCANQESAAAAWTILNDHPPVIVDWLPWNHTFGANHNFNMMLRNGGTLYIDEGKPVPALIGKTIANLREVSPTVYFNVPRGYAALLDHLEKDEALQQKFFARLDLMLYAAAALPQSLWDRLERLGVKVRGRKVPFVASWGMTETAPAVTMVHFPMDRPGNIGVPGPGMQVKLVPVEDKLEIRVKGPNVTPGYFKAPDLTAKAFDEDGWLRTGDAVRFAEEGNPAAGLLFDGRVAENFKLTTGTWVNVGMLRPAVIAAGAPVIEDAVITGHDGDEIGLLIFPEPGRTKALCSDLGADAKLEDMVGHPAVKAALAEGLAKHNAQAQGSSMRIARCLVMTEPPSIDANEITDKGYLNQRAVLTKRAALVERLHGRTGGAGRDRDFLRRPELSMDDQEPRADHALPGRLADGRRAHAVRRFQRHAARRLRDRPRHQGGARGVAGDEDGAGQDRCGGGGIRGADELRRVLSGAPHRAVCGRADRRAGAGGAAAVHVGVRGHPAGGGPD